MKLSIPKYTFGTCQRCGKRTRIAEYEKACDNCFNRFPSKPRKDRGTKRKR